MEKDSSQEVLVDYNVIFRSSFCETGWFQGEDGKDYTSSLESQNLSPAIEEERGEMAELESKLSRLEEILASKDEEIGNREEEIGKLQEELEIGRISLEKVLEDKEQEARMEGVGSSEEGEDAQDAFSSEVALKFDKTVLELEKEEIENERAEFYAMKEDYEQKLSILSEREYELNRVEDELEKKKEELENTATATTTPTEQDPKFQLDTLMEKGKAFTAEKQYLQAYFFFRLATYLEPNNLSAMNNLSISLFRLGFKEKAETCIRRVIELDPENESAKSNLERMLKT